MTTGRTVRWMRISAERAGSAAVRAGSAVAPASEAVVAFTKSRLVIMGVVLVPREPGP